MNILHYAPSKLIKKSKQGRMPKRDIIEKQLFFKFVLRTYLDWSYPIGSGLQIENLLSSWKWSPGAWCMHLTAIFTYNSHTKCSHITGSWLRKQIRQNFPFLYCTLSIELLWPQRAVQWAAFYCCKSQITQNLKQYLRKLKQMEK